MPIIADDLNTIDVYQFSIYSIQTDKMQKSRRYATERAIRGIKEAKIIFESRRTIDRSIIELPNTDLVDMTPIGFEPRI